MSTGTLLRWLGAAAITTTAAIGFSAAPAQADTVFFSESLQDGDETFIGEWFAHDEKSTCFGEVLVHEDVVIADGGCVFDD